MKKKTLLKTAFDTYCIVKQIGNGGNGTVYEATDSDSNPVAIKLLVQMDSTEKRKRFKNEISFCQKYSNKNIIAVKDCGFFADGDKEYIFYVMPLCKESLRARMRAKMSEQQVIKAFLDICNGLKYAHEHGCIHRDLKPENILIDQKDDYIIADFGIAHFSDLDKATTIETKPTARLANFSYRAPEQLEGFASPASDIFALGLILNEMFTGKIPSGENYKKISDVNEDYAFLDKLVQKMLSQNPSDRFANIDALLLDFEAYKSTQEKAKQIAALQAPLIVEEIKDSLIENPIAIKDIKIDNHRIIATLTNWPNSQWADIFPNALNPCTIFPYCYKHFQFYKNSAYYNISEFEDCSNKKDLLQGLIQQFQSAIVSTNNQYKDLIIKKHQKQKQEELLRRQSEIKRLEDEDNMNRFLKSLI